MSPIPCPSCRVDLPPGGASTCPSCGLSLTGPAAARLWEVDQAIAGLQVERVGLVAVLRGQAPTAAGVPAAGAPAAGVPVTTASGWSAAFAPQRLTGQRLLLGVGVLLVLVAALVFLAVAWERMGVGGQVAAMAVLTGLAAYSALRLSGARLGSSAEAMAALAAGLMLLDVAAARSLGLGSLESIDLRSYGAATGAGMALTLAALHRGDRRIAAFAVTALMAASVAWISVLGWFTDSLAEFAAVSLCGAVLFGAAATLLPRSAGLVRSGATRPASLWLLLGLGTAVLGAFDGRIPQEGLTAVEAGSVALLVVVATGCFALLTAMMSAKARQPGGLAAAKRDWLARPLSGTWQVPSVLALAATVAAPASLAAPGWQSGPAVAAATACVVAAAAAILVWTRLLGGRLVGLWAEVVAFTALAGTVSSSLRWESEAATAVALLSMAAAYAVVAVCRPTVRSAFAALAIASAALGSGLAGGLYSDGARVGLVAVVGVAAASLALARRGRDEEAVLGAGAVVVAAAAILDAGLQGWPYAVAGLCALTGLLATGYAALPRRRPVVVLGVLGLTGAVWTLLAEAEVETLEAYTLPLAALALGAGLWAGSDTRLSSWVTMGTAATVALMPSALAALDDEGQTRPLITVVAAAAVLALGVHRRWQALVVTGSLAASLVALSQAAPYAIGAPRWLTLGLTGLVLLALGARYEQRRVDARRAARWLSGMR